MHIVIMGCGRVGSTLAHILEDRGNTVAVIDRDPEAFRRLRPSFKGDRVTGMGFDRDVLARAGIERADGFAAVSSGDNSNIIAARGTTPPRSPGRLRRPCARGTTPGIRFSSLWSRILPCEGITLAGRGDTRLRRCDDGP